MLSIRGRNQNPPRVRVGVDGIRGEVEVYGAMVDGPRGCGGEAVADAKGGCEILFFSDVAVGGKSMMWIMARDGSVGESRVRGRGWR